MLCLFSHVVTGAYRFLQSISYSDFFVFYVKKKKMIYFRPAACLNNKTLNSWTIPANRRVFHFLSSFVNFLFLFFFIFSFSFFSFLFLLLNNISRWYTFAYNKKNTREREIGKKLSSHVKNISFFFLLKFTREESRTIREARAKAKRGQS